MNINKVELFKLNIPLKTPFHISLGTITNATNLVVRLHTTEGIYGIGEACPYSYIVGETQETEFELAKKIAPLLIGKNPLAIEQRLQDLNKAVAANPTLKSAFDMALFDLLGKTARMPLYALWGGENNRKIVTDMTVGIDTPQTMAQQAQTFVAEGFDMIKVKLGTNFKDDTNRIIAIRQAIGNEIELKIDANQGWDTPTAIRTLRALAPHNIAYCEEPVPRWNNEALRFVRQNSPIPIMADESVFSPQDAFKIASMQAADYINIKLSKSGGLQQALQIVSVAQAAGIQTQVGCMSESRLALTALVHLAMARQNIIFFDLDSALMLSEDPVIGGITYQNGGQISLPNLNGIGADIDDSYLQKMEKWELKNF